MQCNRARWKLTKLLSYMKWGTKNAKWGYLQSLITNTHTKLTCLNVANWNTNYTQNSAFTVHTLVRSQWAITGSIELGQHRLLSFSLFKTRFEKWVFWFQRNCFTWPGNEPFTLTTESTPLFGLVGSRFTSRYV